MRLITDHLIESRSVTSRYHGSEIFCSKQRRWLIRVLATYVVVRYSERRFVLQIWFSAFLQTATTLPKATHAGISNFLARERRRKSLISGKL